MDKFIHRHNLENYRKQLAETKDEAQRRVLMKLVAEEEAKDRSIAQERYPYLERVTDDAV